MVSAVTISSLSFSAILNSDPRSSPQAISTPLSTHILCCSRISNIHRSRQIPVIIRRRRRGHGRRISAIAEDVVPLEEAQEIVSSGSGNGEATIIQTLLIIAFITLSILTVGVIYIAVTDFLQKREKEKFEKEEAGKKKSGKKSDKKRKVVRGGPRGFGQVKKEDEDFDD